MKTIKPLALAALASATLFSCASSDSMNDTTAIDTSMSETQTMAGNTTMEDADAVVVEREIVAPVATIPVATLSLKNDTDVNEMFNAIDDTEKYNLIELAKTSSNLSTFITLAEYAGIDDDLMRDGSFTLFAPTNEAFSKLSKEDLEMLMLPENKAKLISVLQAHVLPSEVSSTQFNSTQRIKLSDNRYIPIDTQLNGTQVLVGGAAIVVPNVEASNGVIHVVDNVIIPSQDAVDDDFR